MFPSKLRSRWSDYFIITKVLASGEEEIKYLGDSHTFTVNGQRLKIYSGGKIPNENVSLILAEPYKNKVKITTLKKRLGGNPSFKKN